MYEIDAEPPAVKEASTHRPWRKFRGA
jgi:hypothetical protein